MTVPTGPLATLGSAMGKVVALEQKLSTALNAVAAVLPSFPAVRITDMDIGLPHAHAHPPNLIPPAPPVPLPSTGPVIPIPIFSGAEKTLINTLPAARCGDMGLGIWCGGYFPMYEIFLGSSNVWIESARAARVGVDITKHCIFTSPKPQDPPMGPMVGFTVTSSANVLIGGVPMPSLFALAFGAALKVFGKLLKAGARAAQKLGQRLGRNMKPGFLKCTILRAEPVNTVTGEVVVDQHDFSLPGRIPLEWTRHYSSQSERPGACGHGWETPADARLEFEPDGSVVFYDGGPGASIFPALPTTEPVLALVDGARLSKSYDAYAVRTRAGLVYQFRRPLSAAKELLVESITDPHGNFWRFRRHGRDLYEIQESAGRIIEVKTRDGRIERLALRHSDLKQPHVFVQYEYDRAGNLITVYDALNAPYRFAYENHCLVRHTDRNRLSFYYEYDHCGPAGRCLHSWGDGGLYNYHFDYLQTVDKDLNLQGETRITDSLGNVATLRYDDRNLVLEEIDPLGGVTKYEYDEVGRTVAVIDPAANRHEYKYDEHGNLIKLTRPDGTTAVTSYNEDSCPVKMIDPNGNTWHYEWDSRAMLIKRITPRGGTWLTFINEHGDLYKAVNPLGDVLRVEAGSFGDIVSLSDFAGRTSRFEYDPLGNTVASIDPAGDKTYLKYDKKSRLVEITLSSGGRVQYAYDGEDRVIRFVDEENNCIKIEYTGLGEIARWIQADGAAKSYHYDTEEHLVAVINERGEKFCLSYDALGRVVKEIDYWGNAKENHYNAVGCLSRIVDSLGRETLFDYDALGGLQAVRYYDGKEEKFTRDANGNIVACENDDISISRRFNEENQLIEELQGEFKVVSEYDLAGRRIRRYTSNGQTIGYDYDGAGALRSLSVDGHAVLLIARDVHGRPIQERFSNTLERRSSYNSCGYVAEVLLRSDGREISNRQYEYDATGNVIKRNDSREGSQRFVYDSVGRIIQYTDTRGRVRHINYDRAGNLGTEISGKESFDRALKFADITYRWDAAGNLVKRISPERTLSLSWDGNNRLAGVSGSRVGRLEMGYDPFGRRIYKQSDVGRQQFFWDGDHFLGEEGDGRLGQIVYHPGTFEPVLLVRGKDDVVFFLTEPNGAPHALVDAAGNTVWSAVYGPWSEVEYQTVSVIENPLRLQGQYFDRETGLAYNRHRYYDSTLGSFLSQDPLGLTAGDNLYCYADNVWSWIDPYGLTCVWRAARTVPPTIRPNGSRYYLVSPTRLIVGENHFKDILKVFQRYNGRLNLFRANYWKHVLPHYHVYDSLVPPVPKANMRKAFEQAPGHTKRTLWPWQAI